MKLTTQEHGHRILTWLEEGLSYRQIGEQLGCHHTTVAAFCGVNYPQFRRKPQVAAEVVHSSMRILVLDIETRPGKAYIWNSRFDRKFFGADEIIEDTAILCFVAKWLDNDRIIFSADWKSGHNNMIQSLWNLLDQADAVIHYNGQRFDIPHINREFIQAGMLPPSPYKQIDLFLTARRFFRFMSNKLDNVSREMGVGRKTEHEGFGLWVKCIEGDKDAQRRMEEYNRQDVLLTEATYYKLRPWILNHPSFAALLSEAVCPKCGSDNLKPRGTVSLKTRTYKRYVCGDCGSWSRQVNRDRTTTITETPNC